VRLLYALAVCAIQYWIPLPSDITRIMSTGNRCVIYNHIDALSEARTVADLVRRLQPILSELAYYGVTGETAVLEAHEEWRTQYTDRLRSESTAPPPAGGGFSAAPPEAHEPAFSEPAARPHRGSGRSSERPSTSHSNRAPSRPSPASERASQAPARPSQVPARPGPQESDSRSYARAANSDMYTPGRIANSAGVPRALLAIMSGTHPSLKD
jgi:hypothetical protein